MFELPSALFLIADGNEFRFARFYIVYEGVQLGRLESPLIVFGVPDMSPSDCPNVEETRNPMQISGRKKCSHFFTKNIPSEIEGYDLLVLFLLMPNGTACLKRQSRFLCNGQMKPVYLPDICSSCFMIIFLTISPPMLPACAEVKSPL